MIKINKLISKEDLFGYLGDKNISRIELKRGDNDGLKNKSLCRVSIFISLPEPYHVNELVGSLTNAIGNHPKWNKGNKCFVGGIRNAKHCQFINYSDILRLKQIELEEGLNFGIPNEVLEIISKYK